MSRTWSTAIVALAALMLGARGLSAETPLQGRDVELSLLSARLDGDNVVVTLLIRGQRDPATGVALMFETARPLASTESYLEVQCLSHHGTIAPEPANDADRPDPALRILPARGTLTELGQSGETWWFTQDMTVTGVHIAGDGPFVIRLVPDTIFNAPSREVMIELVADVRVMPNWVIIDEGE